ncbi:aldo/keto reductase [Mucilaginibacter sp. SP1R1]|uniref:aldo/keto reductase n=1 Tax=Mucilaginibacter sp. SP1R1 TaxID=2723091 RepID=UPI001614279E|nr:aldo/keto reductase [Mucilaginibacter sp. SP1R1]MBB6148660.1 aryl-alcohol dehydrogenase-like predicted oxidoreductase [Mucilaginibacter sp. SP1R1]
MEKRKLGNLGLKTAPLVFGGNVFGWTVKGNDNAILLDAFLDAGFNTVDTADVYSRWVPGNKGGESETEIGKWLKQSGKREQVIIATKVGAEFAADKKGLKKDYIIKAAEDSLSRLQTDYIDLYQSHYDDASTPVEETLSAYDQLIKDGKVRAIGASNFSVEKLHESLKVSREKGLAVYQTLQPEYNLFDRQQYETTVEPFVKEQNIGVISYFSLASGFLSGKYRSAADLEGSNRASLIKKYLTERGFRILKALDEVAAQYNAKPAAIALAWLIARPGITAPIVSATSVSQLNELALAATLQLSPEAIEALNTASAY